MINCMQNVFSLLVLAKCQNSVISVIKSCVNSNCASNDNNARVALHWYNLQRTFLLSYLDVRANVCLMMPFTHFS